MKIYFLLKFPKLTAANGAVDMKWVLPSIAE